MSLFSVTDKVPEDYIMVLINSKLISHYVDNFINNTQTFQINDARQLPIIIPNELQNLEALNYAKDAINTKKQTNSDESFIKLIQKKVDSFALALYCLDK